MDSPPENQSPGPDPLSSETSGRQRVSFRKVAWLLGSMLALLIAGRLVLREPVLFIALAMLAVMVVIPILVPLAGRGVGRKRDWPATAVKYGSIAFVVLWLGGLAGVIGTAYFKVRSSSTLKAMIPRQMSAAIDQFYLENGNRIFVSYRELVGPQQYVKAYNPVDGEDLGIQFPIRREWSNPLPVRLPDGTTVQRYEVLAAVGRSGLIATYPRPQEDHQEGGYSLDRVYRLDCGVSYRGNDVVDLPPDPAGREGRDQDGVHVYQLADGRRFEITYHGGVPDGPFRAFFPDGRPWGEATYQKGRLVGPSWLILRDGRKIDELAEGEAAEAAMAGDLAAATKEVKARAREKLQAGGTEDAIKDLDRALSINPLDLEAYRLRGDAYRKLGNLDRTISDYTAADGFTAERAAEYQIPPHLQEVFFERWKQRAAQGDAGGAAADARVLINTAVWNAEARLADKQPAAATAALAPALAVGAPADVYALHAQAGWMQGRLAEAEADYTRAIELAKAGQLQQPANQRLLLARYHYQRGHVERWLGKHGQAATDFQAAGPLLGDSGEVRQGHAALWRFVATGEAGHRDQAVADLAAAGRNGWWPPEAALADFLLGRISDQQLTARIAKSNQDDDRLLASLFIGLQHEQAGNTAGAGENYRKAAQCSGYDFMAREAARRAAQPFATAGPTAKPRLSPPTPAPIPEQVRLSAAYRKAAASDYAGAEAELTALIDSGPPKAGYYLRRARLRHFQDNLDGAIEDYGRAESLAPTQSQAAFERAHVLRSKHDLAGAAREYRTVLEKDGQQFHPSSGRVVLWLYATECEQGRGDDARRELEAHMQRLDALKKNDLQQPIAYLDTQLASLLLGRIGEPLAEVAVRDAPVRAQPEFRFKFLFFSALARRLAGDEAGARERFQRALNAYPGVDGYAYEFAEARKAVAGAAPPAPGSVPSR